MELLALAAALCSLVLSVTLPLLLRDGALRGAFNALEEDFENLQETVRSALGRVGRLKRAIMRGEVPTQEGTEPEGGGDSTDGNGSSPALSQRQLALNQKILSRRRTI